MKSNQTSLGSNHQVGEVTRHAILRSKPKPLGTPHLDGVIVKVGEVGDEDGRVVLVVERDREGQVSALRGNQKHYEAIRSTPRQSEALRGNQKHSEAIRRNPVQSDAIRGNQTHSGAIRRNPAQSDALRGSQKALRGNQAQSGAITWPLSETEKGSDDASASIAGAGMQRSIWQPLS